MADFQFPLGYPADAAPIVRPFSNVAGPIYMMSAALLADGRVLCVWTQRLNADGKLSIRQGYAPSAFDYAFVNDSVVFDKNLAVIDSGTDGTGAHGNANVQIGPDGNIYLMAWGRSDVNAFDPGFAPFPGDHGAWLYTTPDDGVTWNHVSTFPIAYNPLGWAANFGALQDPGEILEVTSGPFAGRWLAVQTQTGNYFGLLVVGGAIWASDDSGLTWVAVSTYVDVYGGGMTNNLNPWGDGKIYRVMNAPLVVGHGTHWGSSLDSQVWTNYVIEFATGSPSDLFDAGAWFRNATNGEHVQLRAPVGLSLWTATVTDPFIAPCVGCSPAPPGASDWTLQHTYGYTNGNGQSTYQPFIQKVGPYVVFQRANQLLGIQSSLPGVGGAFARFTCCEDTPALGCDPGECPSIIVTLYIQSGDEPVEFTVTDPTTLLDTVVCLGPLDPPFEIVFCGPFAEDSTVTIPIFTDVCGGGGGG